MQEIEVMNMARLLPILKRGKKYFFCDERLGEARNVINPHDRHDVWDCKELGAKRYSKTKYVSLIKKLSKRR